MQDNAACHADQGVVQQLFPFQDLGKCSHLDDCIFHRSGEGQVVVASERLLIWPHTAVCMQKLTLAHVSRPDK